MSHPAVRRSGIWADAPDILLVQLFEHGARAALHDDGLPFAVRVSHVCRYWRFVAFASPSVWAHVPVHPLALRPGLTELFINRSGEHLSLDLCVNLRSERSADATLAFVLLQNERIRELYLHAQGNPAVFLFISRLKRLTLPRLVHFEIDLTKNTRGEPLGHLPHILNEDPPATLSSVSLRGVCFEYHSMMLKSLTSLTLADLPLRMAAPSYTTFRDLLAASPNLSHLKLDGVFPILTNAIDYGTIELPNLHTLELVIKRVTFFIPTFFTILSVPNLHTFSFESPLVPNWEGFEDAFSALQATFAGLRTLRLAATGYDLLHLAGVRPELFHCFPQLEYLTLTAYDDRLILYFLRPWIAVVQGQRGENVQESVVVWSNLQLLTVRAPFDSEEAEDDDGIDDTLEFLDILRFSMDLPFEVWQECVARA